MHIKRSIRELFSYFEATEMQIMQKGAAFYLRQIVSIQSIIIKPMIHFLPFTKVKAQSATALTLLEVGVRLKGTWVRRRLIDTKFYIHTTNKGKEKATALFHEQ